MIILTGTLDFTQHIFSCFSIKIQSTLISSSALPAPLLSVQFSGYLKQIRNVCRFTGGHLIVILVWITNHELIISLLMRGNTPPVFVKFEKVKLSNHAECLTRWNKTKNQSMCSYQSMLKDWFHRMAHRKHTCNRETNSERRFSNKAESCSLHRSLGFSLKTFQVSVRIGDYIWHTLPQGICPYKFGLCLGSITEDILLLKNTSTQGHKEIRLQQGWISAEMINWLNDSLINRELSFVFFGHWLYFLIVPQTILQFV